MPLFEKKNRMHNYRELDIYKESKALAIELHSISLAFPKFELYEERSQLRRSSKAVPAMIVEGYGRRRYKADFIKYLIYSVSECDETILHLDLLYQTKSFKDELSYKRLRDAYELLSKKINKYTQWVEDHYTPPHLT
jgi:four helix bundle protein